MTATNAPLNPQPEYIRLAPKLRDISHAQNRHEIDSAISDAVRAVGGLFYSFSTDVPRQEGMLFQPALYSLPEPVVSEMLAKGLYQSNPILSSLRTTGRPEQVALDPHHSNPIVADVSRLVAPFGVAFATLVPVLSVTNDLAVLGAYSSTPLSDDGAIAMLQLIGTAASIRLLELHDKAGSVTLSASQSNILRWAAAGKSNGDIAAILGLTPRNCAYHLGEIYRKLGVGSRAQAIVLFRQGIVRLSE